MPFKFRKKNISSFEFSGYVLIIMGIGILLWGIKQFNLLGRADGLTSQQIGERYGQYGEFIGGIVGSLWALAGVLLFFATLIYQKKEFELQRVELHKTQQIFQQQNFSTLFISFLAQQNAIVSNLKASDINQVEWRGTNFFIFFKEKVMSSFIGKVRSIPKENRSEKILYALFKDYFTYHFRFYESKLNPYLRNFTVLLSMIERFHQDSDGASDYYSLIIKSNLSSSELFLLYHLAEFRLKSEFNHFEQQTDLFENMPLMDRVQEQVESEKC